MNTMNETAFEHNMLPGSLELAYLGDTVYDYYVRRALILRGGKVNALHRQAIGYVCARAQSEAFGRIEAELTEQELAIARRARNAHQNPPRNADPAAYHRATGFEALIGYLTLTGQSARVDELLRHALGELYTEEIR